MRKCPDIAVEQDSALHGPLGVRTPDAQERRLNPGYATAEEVSGLPPTTIGVAGFDPLRDEGLLYGKLLAENG